MTAARRKALDRLRRDQTLAHKQQLVELELEHSMAEEGSDPTDWLRLIFTCCHPALNAQAQVALTLRTLCGLSVHRDRARVPHARAHRCPMAGTRQAQDQAGWHPLPGAARSCLARAAAMPS